MRDTCHSNRLPLSTSVSAKRRSCGEKDTPGTLSVLPEGRKNPDDPDLALEGYIVATADYTKSFSGPLRTMTVTPVIIPVYDHINTDFGIRNNTNYAGKLYFLLYDTDIDFMFQKGNSRPSRYGMDFSRNITSNFEIPRRTRPYREHHEKDHRQERNGYPVNQ